MIKKYNKKLNTVDAIRFIGTNIRSIGKFLDTGTTLLDKDMKGWFLECPTMGSFKIYVGAYVVKDDDSYYVMSADNFTNFFKEIGE